MINYLTGTNYTQKLTDYPATNTTAFALIKELSDEMHKYDPPDLRDTDLFDMFCHWLVAVKKFKFRTIRYWKIAPGENAWNWDACRDGGFIAIGWDELGDVSGLSQGEFNARRDKAIAAHDDWTKSGANQVWKFAHIDEGDRIVANRGTTEVLGIGTVAGPYYFVKGQRHGHRLPVEWDDLGPRKVDEYGWRRTLVALDREKFKAICSIPSVQVQAGAPSIWWVNQGTTLSAEKDGGFLWAPLRSKAGHSMYHWDTLDELEQGDIVVHYANGALRYVSQVVAPAVVAERPHSFAGSDWEEEGRLAKTEYHDLTPAIPLQAFARDLLKLDISQGPLDTQGGVKQGYLFRLIPEAMEIVRASQPRVAWPDFVPSRPLVAMPYTLAECAAETGWDESLLARWVRAIERKGQAILYGPPGTGKTYVAERLARHLIAGADGFVDLVQFHPAYAYEDFIQGIRPQSGEGGGLEYPIVPGRFLEFCRKAKKRTGTCALIIDEINRANLARVFGELMYLLEYRDREIPLAGGGVLRIPSNVRIIGTMNTADRSIALVDHALRRRFAFLALYPNYDILRHYHQTTGFDVETLISVLKKLNRQIGDRHYEVGITFFLQEDLAEQIDDIWRMEIEPYLEEYFFDQPDKVEAFHWDKVEKDILQ